MVKSLTASGILFSLCFLLVPANAVELTQFSYQGKLTNNAGVALTGSYDFRFRLFDNVSVGSQIGLSLDKNGVSVQNGIFSTILDFGNQYTGGNRWLDIQVKPSASGSYSALSPRQPISSVPYAVTAFNLPSPFTISGNSSDSASPPAIFNAYNSHIAGRALYGRQGAGYGYNAFGGAIWGDAREAIGVIGTSNDSYGMLAESNNNSGLIARNNTAGTYAYLGNPTSAIYGNSNEKVGVDGDSYSNTGVKGSSINGNGGDFSTYEGIALHAERSANGTFVNLADQYNGIELECMTVGGNGIYAKAHNGGSAYAVWGYSTDGYAGWFTGKVNVSGNFTATSKSFKIDHPLDPEHKYLYHASIESSERKNLYDGTIKTDSKGEAVVSVPDWFEALNTDFRYQLTVIGEFAQAIIAKEITGGKFTIKTDKPNIKVSWQVTGIRKDAWAAANPFVVEEDKPADQQGAYQDPQAFGKPVSMSADQVRLKRLQLD